MVTDEVEEAVQVCLKSEQEKLAEFLSLCEKVLKSDMEPFRERLEAIKQAHQKVFMRDKNIAVTVLADQKENQQLNCKI